MKKPNVQESGRSQFHNDPIPTRNPAPVTSASLDSNAKINVDGCLESDNVKAIRGMSNVSKPVQLPRWVEYKGRHGVYTVFMFM